MATFWYEIGKLGFLSGIGPDKECVLGEGGYDFMIESKKFDLAVHPWTSRAEVNFVDSSYATAEDELRWLYCKRGISGMFTENVDTGIIVGVRGCDDYMTAEELLEEDITEIEEEDGGGVGGTISKEICSERENGNATLQNFGYLASGIAIGVLTSFFYAKAFGGRWRSSNDCDDASKKIIQHGTMRGMQTLSTCDSNDSDPGMEII